MQCSVRGGGILTWSKSAKIGFRSDLGRFGLGLKTASLSQCRCLTVATKQNAVLSARRWDLDLVEERQDWIQIGPGTVWARSEDGFVVAVPMLNGGHKTECSAQCAAVGS